MPLLPRCAWECILGFKGKYKLGKKAYSKKAPFSRGLFSLFALFTY
ncbi:hypothetical protein [uncultured Gammaproteobacteria bacterium]|nr:hypothetical protein [uncultured Gammaproteobacteria bacterium]